MFWGLSPALDLVEEFTKLKELDDRTKVLNILLIGSTDARHILMTMSRLKRHSSHLKVNFFVMDQVMELVARQILLLTIALEPSDKVGLREKAWIFMETYGNTMVRNSTGKYIVNKMVQIRKALADPEFLEMRIPTFDLSLLRHVDMDYLEEAAKYYQDNKRYMICRIWDQQLRASMEEGYDRRFEIYDWDYNLVLVRIPGGQRVTESEFVFWRNTGIAFTWLETDYSVGNPTLVAGIGSAGDTLYSHGYMGDMESGPYYAFGTHSEERTMLEVRNDINVFRATDITERNLQRIFYELEHGRKPDDRYTCNIEMGMVVIKQSIIDVDKEVNLEFEPEKTPEDYSAIPVPNSKVIFLPGNAMELYPSKSKYKEFFDVVFVAQNFFKFLNEEIMKMVKPDGCLVLETRKFVIALDKDIGKFGKEVRTKLDLFGWEEITKYHFKRDDHVVCRKKNKDSPLKGVSKSKEEKDETSESITAENFPSEETSAKDHENDGSVSSEGSRDEAFDQTTSKGERKKGVYNSKKEEEEALTKNKTAEDSLIVPEEETSGKDLENDGSVSSEGSRDEAFDQTTSKGEQKKGVYNSKKEEEEALTKNKTAEDSPIAQEETSGKDNEKDGSVSSEGSRDEAFDLTTSKGERKKYVPNSKKEALTKNKTAEDSPIAQEESSGRYHEKDGSVSSEDSLHCEATRIVFSPDKIITDEGEVTEITKPEGREEKRTEQNVTSNLKEEIEINQPDSELDEIFEKEMEIKQSPKDGNYVELENLTDDIKVCNIQQTFQESNFN